MHFEPTRRQWARTHADTPLIGLVHGHYEIDAAVKSDADDRGSDDVSKVGVNAGIATVIPASAIVELFMYEEFVEARKQMKRR